MLSADATGDWAPASAAHGIELLPGNLLDASRELKRGNALDVALDNAAREDYVDYFMSVRRREFQEAHEQITQWDLDRYLQLC